MQEVTGSIPVTSTNPESLQQKSPSSRGPGHRPFTAVTGVRIPLGTPRILAPAFPSAVERLRIRYEVVQDGLLAAKRAADLQGLAPRHPGDRAGRDDTEENRQVLATRRVRHRDCRTLSVLEEYLHRAGTGRRIESGNIEPERVIGLGNGDVEDGRGCLRTVRIPEQAAPENHQATIVGRTDPWHERDALHRSQFRKPGEVLRLRRGYTQGGEENGP